MHESADIPLIEPTEITAKTTVKWEKDLSDHYPASTWTLKYYFRLENGTGAGNDALDKTAAQDTDDLDIFAVTLSSTDTAKTVGRWVWQAYVEKSGERYRVDAGSFELKQNLLDVTATYDGRSHAKTMLDAIESVLEGRAAYSDLELDHHGRRVRSMTHKELIEARDYYRARYAEEQAKEKRDNGQATGRRILTRFGPRASSVSQ